MLFNDWNNIGFAEINELLSKKEELKVDKFIEINLIKKDDFYGQIDQSFISYVILFLGKYKELKIKLNFSDSINSDRFFSFSDQINQAKLLYNEIINDNNFIVTGKYINATTGEELECKNYKGSIQSSSFIPPLLIYKSKEGTSLESLFKKPINVEDILSKKYHDKLISEFNSFVPNHTISNNIKKYANSFRDRVSEFSFIKVCILRILLEEDRLFLFKRKRNIENLKIIENIELFCDNLIIGLKELAQNVVEHSESDGVITIRKYNKEVLSNLKSNDEKEFIEISSKNVKDFLDINIIDLGSQNIKEKYKSNLEKTRNDFKEYIEKHIIEDEKELVYSGLNISFDNDIERISSTQFTFNKFFIKEEEGGINQLSVQKNKFISKIGLQYFTAIVKDKYQGFIKISSGVEKTILYNIENSPIVSTDLSEDFIKYGTFYNCIIPIINWKEAKEESTLTPGKDIKQEENTFVELSKYNYIGNNDSIQEKFNYSKKNIIDFPVQISDFITQMQNHNKYLDFFTLYTKFSLLKNNRKSQFSKKMTL